MRKRSKNIIEKAYPLMLGFILLILWQAAASAELVKSYLLPSPIKILQALIRIMPELTDHIGITLFEALFGLAAGVALAFVIALLMDSIDFLYKAVYPLLVISQTVPIVAIAPLLVLWLGYGLAPKIVLVILICFFPIAIGMLDGFKSADRDAITLLRAMGATRTQIFFHIKLPSSLGGFFAGLKISVAYSVVGAVIAEWLGGSFGLGVYMTRVRKSYAYDNMFAVIILISVLSLLLINAARLLQKKAMPWENNK